MDTRLASLVKAERCAGARRVIATNTDEVISQGRSGELNGILQRAEGCEAWGPIVPVSEAR